MPALPRVLLTGVSGFVGGTILSTLSDAHPGLRIKVLVRQESAAKTIQAAYPNVEIVSGDLSSLSLITSTAASVDCVIHAAGDNTSAVRAMIDGLASRRMSGQALGYLINITGPRSLIDLSKPITGDSTGDSRPWSDVYDAEAILNVPEDRIHAGADRAIVAHSVARGVGSMLLSPGQLWGRGKGPLKKESNSATYFAAVKDRGQAFVVGSGTATWSWTSIADLASAVTFLLERMLMDGVESSGRIGVNEEGYYFVSTGDLSMIERAREISQRLGLEGVQSISAEDATAIHPFGHLLWGCGERIRADKLAALGWRPRDLDWRALMKEEGGERA